MGHITLVYGGTRSGKSSHAMALAGSLSPTVYYIATAQPLDGEMAARIERHRQSRPARFVTIEEPLDLRRALRKIRSSTDAILVDCLTLFLSNLLLREVGDAGGGADARSACSPGVEDRILGELGAFLAAVKGRRNPCVLVSNEVGQSLVAPSPLGRLFGDLQGLANQQVSQAAQKVIKMEAGIPVVLKSWRPPFRLGATSYIYPADILENVKRLLGRVEDIELVLFETDQGRNLSEREIEKLALLRYGRDLSFTAHLPLGLMLGGDKEERATGVEVIRRLIEQLRPLSPLGFILHLPVVRSKANTDFIELEGTDLTRWQEGCRRSLEEILAIGIDPPLLCLENLGYPFAYVEEFLEGYGLSVCLDVGHLALYGLSIPEFVDHYLPRTRIVHLHGCDGKRDHLALANPLPMDQASLLERLCQREFSGVLTLEVFSEKDLHQSQGLIQDYLGSILPRKS